MKQPPPAHSARTARRRTLGRIFILLGAAGLLLFGSLLLLQQYNYRQAQTEYAALQAEYTIPSGSVSAGNGGAPQVDTAALQAQNPDFVAWLDIPGTGIQYPVVQANDNDYYLRRTFSGTQNRAGSIFMDYRCTDFSDANTILYGHNMRDDTMFAALKAYEDPAFLREHAELTLYTPQQTLSYTVLFAARIPGDALLYSTAGADATTTGQVLATLAATQGITLPSSDASFLTLSTCDKAGDRETRYVVIAVLAP